GARNKTFRRVVVAIVADAAAAEHDVGLEASDTFDRFPQIQPGSLIEVLIEAHEVNLPILSEQLGELLAMALDKMVPFVRVRGLIHAVGQRVEGKRTEVDVVPVRMGEVEIDLEVMTAGRVGHFLDDVAVVGALHNAVGQIALLDGGSSWSSPIDA